MKKKPTNIIFYTYKNDTITDRSAFWRMRNIQTTLIDSVRCPPSNVREKDIYVHNNTLVCTYPYKLSCTTLLVDIPILIQ